MGPVLHRVFAPLLLPLLLIVLLASSSFTYGAEDNGWTVIFRSDDPMIWNHDTGDPAAANGYAISLGNVRPFRYLRLTRMDKGEYVIVAMDRVILARSEAFDGGLWWSGAARVGGTQATKNRVLGIGRTDWTATIPDEHLIGRAPGKKDQGYRGWGFSKAASVNLPEQTYSWEGQPIDKTIFEIAVRQNDLKEEEKAHLLQGNGASGKPALKEAAEASTEPTELSTAARSGPANPASLASPTTRIARQQSSIHALYVRETDSGDMLGQSSELILTATPGKPPRDGVTPVTFATKAGSEMHMVKEDAARWIRLKYPRWEASKVELSFEDKYTPKDGGSIGAAIGTLMLSMIEGFNIDPKLAITGDVTADGKIRAIGGVAAKTRGATAAGCTLMALPADNYPQVVDAFVWEGPKLLTGIQVIGVSNLTEAGTVARADRDEKLAQAIKLFGEVQAKLAKSPDSVHYKEVLDKLNSIVDLAPNHYSAKLLLAVGQNKQPHKLSATASMYYTFVAIGNIGPTLMQRAKNPQKGQVTPSVVKDGLRSLDKVRRLAAPETIPFVNAWTDFIKSVNDFETGVGTAHAVEVKLQQVDDAMAKLRTNRDLMEKMLHEGI